MRAIFAVTDPALLAAIGEPAGGQANRFPYVTRACIDRFYAAVSSVEWANGSIPAT
jgi:hypothetical protein